MVDEYIENAVREAQSSYDIVETRARLFKAFRHNNLQQIQGLLNYVIECDWSNENAIRCKSPQTI
jgi:hypothetical protein